MSKYMQLKVTVTPFYENSFAGTYPRLARHLHALKRDLAEENPSLYALAAQWDRLLYAFEGTPLREVLLRHRKEILNLHKGIEENMATWHLAQADRLLYTLEDIFEKIESELS